MYTNETFKRSTRLFVYDDRHGRSRNVSCYVSIYTYKYISIYMYVYICKYILPIAQPCGRAHTVTPFFFFYFLSLIIHCQPSTVLYRGVQCITFFFLFHLDMCTYILSHDINIYIHGYICIEDVCILV